MLNKATRRLQLIAATSVLAAAGLSPAHAANLVVNGDFEAPSISTTFQCFATTLSGWKSTSTADHGSCYIAGGKGGWPPSFSGLQYMYINNYADAGASVQQSILLEAGTRYSLTFALGGLDGTAGGLNVAFGTFSAAIAPQTLAGWQTYSYIYTPTVSGAAPLKFTTATPWVVTLDAVSVTALPVPEPASMLLMACGLGALAVLKRREGRKA